ncbi:MAG TPA: molybdopterin cofactor-binding domain-containing protein [Xanthomonadales bacterium]|nr:molybdopterin cofactor-binding domain-containing protein [Xanthomonadales bacterium]
MSPVSRRQFLQLGVMSGAGLLLGVRVMDAARAAEAEGEASVLNPLIHIEPGGRVVLFAQNPEMGQGVKTSLPMILAEELDVPFEAVEVRQADWLPGRDLQFSGGSLSIRLNYQAMREAGAAARHLLLQAASAQWKLPLETLSTDRARVLSADGAHSASYGELASAAARLPLPEDVPLKSPAEFRIVGTSRSDVDLPAIVAGKPLFSLDLKLPGMLVAVVRRSPASDGQVASFDAEAALAVPGVRAVHLLSNEQHGGRIIQPNSPNFVSGVAVLADDTWAALQGAGALDVQWLNPPDPEGTEALYARFHAGLDAEPEQVRRDGEPEALLDAGDDVFEQVYQVPLLAHAPMEPMNCTARYDEGRVELWAPTQNPGGAAEAVGKALGVEASAVTVHVLRSGGAFGRRYYSDFAIDAALLARHAGRPVKVVWPREDDIRHGYFRPAGVHRIRAALDAEGRIAAWHHRLAGHSREAYLGREDPPWSSEIATHTFPAGFVPNLLFEHVFVPSRIPLGQWRAVAPSANVFVVASALDELAHRTGTDPLEFLLRVVGDADAVPVIERFSLDTKRLRGVIRKAAGAAGWRQPLGWGDGGVRRGRGIAACYDQGAWVAEVVEVTISGGRLKVDRVVAAVDCGRVINPRGAEAQVQGAILDGLGAALMGEITTRDGVVEQSNFHDYRLLRMGQAPAVEVHFMDSDSEPRGLGEPPLPPLAPALCNAIFAATGRRVRRLPLQAAFEV